MVKKEKPFCVDHFSTISGHFIAKYINIFYNTGIQRNILRCLTSLNLNWINIKNNFFSCVFQFSKEKKTPLINGNFTTICGHFSARYIKILIGSKATTNVRIFFNALKCIISGLFCRSEFWHLLGNQLSCFQNGYFFKILWSFHDPNNQVK